MKQLLSEEYRRVLAHEHATTEWGVVGWKQAPQVHDLVESQGIKTLLDYGAGRGSLGHWFDRYDTTGVQRREYEPGRPGLDHMPEPAELVACIDVMEHIEPHCIDSVLDHIQSLAQRWVYFNISTRPAARTLSDGRNAHLTVEAAEWWLNLLGNRWDQHSFNLHKNGTSFNWVGLVRP